MRLLLLVITLVYLSCNKDNNISNTTGVIVAYEGSKKSVCWVKEVSTNRICKYTYDKSYYKPIKDLNDTIPITIIKNTKRSLKIEINNKLFELDNNHINMTYKKSII